MHGSVLDISRWHFLSLQKVPDLLTDGVHELVQYYSTLSPIYQQWNIGDVGPSSKRNCNSTHVVAEHKPIGTEQIE